jgi:hypothetical protein
VTCQLRVGTSNRYRAIIDSMVNHLERRHDVGQEVAAGSGHGEHVAGDGGEVEIAGCSRVGAGFCGAVGAQHGGDVEVAEHTQNAVVDAAAGNGLVGSAAGVDDGGQVTIAEVGFSEAVGAEDGGGVKVAAGCGCAAVADGSGEVKAAAEVGGDGAGAVRECEVTGAADAE